MNLRTTTVNGKLVDILTYKELRENWKMYEANPSLLSSIAIEMDAGGNKYILPVRGKNDTRPGIYPSGIVSIIKLPDTESQDEYLSNNLNIVDYRNINTVKEFLDKNNQIRDIEVNVLTDRENDSIFVPTITPEDTPEMRALKEAVIAKGIDLNKYAHRFKNNFLNDKRIFKLPNISMNKFKSTCQKLDIEAELTLRDTSSDVANPMNKEITIVLTDIGGEDQ